MSNYTKIHQDTLPPNKEDASIWMDKLALTNDMINDKAILLAGAGMGTELNCLIRLNPKSIDAIDLSDNIYRLKEHFPQSCITFRQADIHELPYKSDLFDVVFNSGVMQQLRSPEIGFRELYRVTKVGGVISIGSIYLSNSKNRAINIARLKYQFHMQGYDEVEKYMKRAIRRRNALQALGLARLDLWLTGLVIPGNRSIQLLQCMDYYYAEYRHLFSDKEIVDWFHVVGIENVKRKNRQHIGEKVI